MRILSFVALAVLAACASMKNPYPDAQAAVDRVASRHDDLVRLTLHAVPADGKECTQVASTMAKRRGKPSDPEDLQAMKDGKVTVLDEKGNVDVTVPILMKSGKPTAVAGVTLKSGEGADRDALVKKAKAIAEELGREVQAAGKPVW